MASSAPTTTSCPGQGKGPARSSAQGITDARRLAAGGGLEDVRRAVLAGSAARLARRMDLHNGYRTLGRQATLAQLHPCTARMSADDDGLLPEWVVYHELVALPRVFLSKVGPALLLPRLRHNASLPASWSTRLVDVLALHTLLSSSNANSAHVYD